MLKELGTIALFLGVVLNAYHYYKLHKWSKKDKNFDLILKIVDSLKVNRDDIYKVYLEEVKLTQEISLFSNLLEDGKPSKDLCYRLYMFEEKTLKLYEDYMFTSKFIQISKKERLLSINSFDKFIQNIQQENQNKLFRILHNFCLWENIMKSHNMNAYIGVMSRLIDMEDINKQYENIQKLFDEID
jgi:hypothetical protein